jgi:hypothetical protein
LSKLSSSKLFNSPQSSQYYPQVWCTHLVTIWSVKKLFYDTNFEGLYCAYALIHVPSYGVPNPYNILPCDEWSKAFWIGESFKFWTSYPNCSYMYIILNFEYVKNITEEYEDLVQYYSIRHTKSQMEDSNVEPYEWWELAKT